MKGILWIAVVFTASIASGACCWFVAGLITGSNRVLEGCLSLALLLTLIAIGTSGVLLLIIGPLTLRDHIRKIRTPVC